MVSSQGSPGIVALGRGGNVQRTPGLGIKNHPGPVHSSDCFPGVVSNINQLVKMRHTGKVGISDVEVFQIWESFSKSEQVVTINGKQAEELGEGVGEGEVRLSGFDRFPR